jgi:hypothetical protein
MRHVLALGFVGLVAVSSCAACAHTVPVAPPHAAKGEPLPAEPAPPPAPPVEEPTETPIAALEDAVLDEHAHNRAGLIIEQSDWDRARPPQFYDFVSDRLALTRTERRLIGEHGFVIRGGDAGTYGAAFERVHREQLPVYVSAAAIMDAIHYTFPPSAPAKGTVPGFMRSKAYADFLEHAIDDAPRARKVAPEYDPTSECADGWLEPLPEVYRAIPGKLGQTLVTIADHELEGRRLTDNERYFMKRAAGWYGELVRDDHHASLGVFIVDAGGLPRLMVGPVPTITNKPYVAPAPADVGVAVRADLSQDTGYDPLALDVATNGRVAALTIEALDHHGEVVGSLFEGFTGIKSTHVTMRRVQYRPEGIRIRSGDFSAEKYITAKEPTVVIERGGVKFD